MQEALEKFLGTPGQWLDAKGPHSDIVISTRIRLARNIDGFPFVHWANKKQLQELIKMFKSIVDKNPCFANSTLLEIEQLNSLIRQFLIERHLISYEHAKGKEKAVLISDKETINIMINEEDHLRVQVFSSGLEIVNTWKIINEIDEILSRELSYAFSLELGYLTACPTNVGTGMRASVLIHLPALKITNQINEILRALSQMGLAIRGLYGEGTEAVGGFYQISNQVTLGRNEEELGNNLEKITHQVIEHEEKTRISLFKEAKIQLEDKVYRAYATLTQARIISSQEALDNLSTVRLGVGIGGVLENPPSLACLNELLIVSQPAHIQLLSGNNLDELGRDIKRAEVIRKKLSKKRSDI